MRKLTDLCWDGLTLKHVSHPKIVKPYLVFVVTALLFELFLLVLFVASVFIFYQYGFLPDIFYFLSGVILTVSLVLTVLVIRTIFRKVYLE